MTIVEIFSLAKMTYFSSALSENAINRASETAGAEGLSERSVGEAPNPGLSI